MPRESERRLRVAFICSQLEIGGQEQSVLGIVRGLDRRRFIPRVYAFRSGRLVKDVEADGVPIFVGQHRTAAGDSWSPADARARVAFRRALAERLRKDRIDVCVVSAWADGISAAREAGVPAIVERLDGPKLIATIRDKSSCDALVCQSHAIRRLVEAQARFFRSEGVPIAVVRNGINLERFDPARYDREKCRRALGFAPDEFVVGSIARLTAVKNLGHLLDAARLLLDRIDNPAKVRVVIAGPDGGSESALRAQVRSLDLTRHVRFLGPRRDVPEVLRALDAFVLPSYQEGVSLAVLEAMAMGVPVVATQVDNIAETAPDAALFVSPLDPYRTALALRDLIEHPALRRELGRRARRLAMRHGLDRMARGYERVFVRAFRAARRPVFRRRVAIVPGHSRATRATGDRLVDRLVPEIARGAADAWVLALHDARGREAAAASSRWPPGRSESFPDNPAGRARRTAILRWIGPDVIVTDCPRIVERARGVLAGEEIVYLPDPDHACPGEARALRAADRIVVATAAERRACMDRWPRWSWKVRRIAADGTDTAAAFERLLAEARPCDPGRSRGRR